MELTHDFEQRCLDYASRYGVMLALGAADNSKYCLMKHKKDVTVALLTYLWGADLYKCCTDRDGVD